MAKELTREEKLNVKVKIGAVMYDAPPNMLVFENYPADNKIHFCADGPDIIENMTNEQIEYLVDLCGECDNIQYNGSHIIGMSYDFELLPESMKIGAVR